MMNWMPSWNASCQGYEAALERALGSLLFTNTSHRTIRKQLKKWVERLRQRAKSGAVTALAGRIVPEFNQKDIREVFLGNYRIVYRVGDDGILILTVFEGHQLLNL